MIYFDNAATTWPKPVSVVGAMTACMRDAGGNPGRSGHLLSVRAGEEVYACREAVSSFLGSSRPENVVFTPNDTFALNLTLKALLRPGDHVIVSEMEHNSVLRPLAALAGKGVKYSVFPVVGKTEEQILDGISKRVRPETRMVCCLHASNVCGIVLPVREIGNLCEKRKIRFVLDAAQSAGSVGLSMSGTGADAICAPGHKGLYGPQGCGFVCFSDRFEGERVRALRPFVEGGNGIASLERGMPDFLPERFEAGTLMTPNLAGLRAGIEEVKALGVERIGEYERALFRRMRDALERIGGVRVYQPEAEGSILLFSAEGKSAAGIADSLDRAGICVRAGFHCAPLAHRALGTPEDGAVRISFSIYNTPEEVDLAAETIGQIVSERAAAEE